MPAHNMLQFILVGRHSDHAHDTVGSDRLASSWWTRVAHQLPSPLLHNISFTDTTAKFDLNVTDHLLLLPNWGDHLEIMIGGALCRGISSRLALVLQQVLQRDAAMMAVAC